MKKSEINALVVFAGLLVLFFGQTWLTSAAHFARDITYVFHPMHVFTAENLQAGRLPLWNPYPAGGVPWMGDPQTGVFYPGNLPFLLFPFPAGFKIHQALHFFLTGLGAYLLARSKRGAPGWALTLAVLWSLNGFWISRLEFPSLLGTVAWLPFVALAFGSAGFRLPVFTLALCFLAGHTPHFLWVLLLGGAWAAAEKGFRVSGWIVAGSVLAVGLAAVQSFNTASALLESARFGDGLSLAESVQYSLSPANLWGWLIPHFSAMREFAYSGEKFFWLGSFHVGVAGAALAVWGWVASPGRHRRIWLGAAALGVILVLGKNGILFDILHRTIPWWRGLRYPGQFSFFIVSAGLFAAVAAAPKLARGARWGPIFLLIVTAELFVYGAGRFPVLPSEYFRARPSWIAPINGSTGGRLFFSPKATASTRAEGRTDRESWTHLRLKLLNLTPVPYHVRGVNPFGFAFVPRGTADWLSRVYASPDFGSVATELNSFNARWLVAPNPLPHPALRLVSTDPWHLYENLHAHPPAWDSDKNIGWSRASGSPNRIEFRGPPLSSGPLTVPEGASAGWEFYARGEPLAVERAGPFAKIRAPAGTETLRAVFRPSPFRTGLAATLIGLMVAGLMSIRTLNKALVTSRN